MPNKASQKEYRHISKLLPIFGKWWGERFRKTTRSGALRWGKGNIFWTYADIAPPESFPFVIECKHHWEVDLDEFLRKHPYHSRVGYFWYYKVAEDTVRAKEETGLDLHPMLIYKQDTKPNRIVIPSDLFYKIPNWKHIPHYLGYHPEGADSPWPQFVVSDLLDFIKMVPRQEMETALGRMVHGPIPALA